MKPHWMVERQKVANADEALEKMRRDTDALLAESARLVKQLDELLEDSRQQLATKEALLEHRRKNKSG